ncbi:MAG: glycosyltransferase family 4 protein [Bdellovibrionales bacterium]|nr:glycosyltransferase family 4 protein [Bdellovibrionales bacterium]
MSSKILNQPNIWIDVTTSFRWKKRPTGIPRTCNSLAQKWIERNDPQIHFCVYSEFTHTFYKVPHEEVQRVTRRDGIPSGESVESDLLLRIKKPSDYQKVNTDGSLKTAAKKVVRWFPEGIQQNIRNILQYTFDILGQLGYISSWLIARMPFAPPWFKNRLSWLGEIRGLKRAEFNMSDTLLSLGSSWSELSYNETVSRLVNARKIQFVPLIYDLIPYRFPHFFSASFSQQFSKWAVSASKMANKILCISQNTKKDIQLMAIREGFSAPEVKDLKLGMDIWEKQGVAPDRSGVTSEIPPFVLCVGTIEVRKNHWTIYQAWQDLLLDLDPNQVPVLAIAGQPGWLSSDITHMIRNNPSTSDKVIALEGLTDQELHWLYENCLFTLYPSFYEGWGLPVAEAMACGKYCISSSTSSLPEVGGDLIDYCAPNDVKGWYQAIKHAIQNPQYRQDKEARIREQFTLQSWEETSAEAIEFIQNKNAGNLNYQEPTETTTRYSIQPNVEVRNQ